ncbi:hypothetical protein GCM10009754_60240 [Amycolatopsis minnesotensis]|uniref:Uncharacterized protein n=1 Tax=Amycolatopsis minnesotensis TaxID=337894 RepID=A0ABP5D9V9_9PSEU
MPGGRSADARVDSGSSGSGGVEPAGALKGALGDPDAAISPLAARDMEPLMP